MGRRIPLTNGDEYDLFTRWRRYLHFRPTEKRRIKRAYRRRERHQARQTHNRGTCP